MFQNYPLGCVFKCVFILKFPFVKKGNQVLER